jgi:hypothetical protein
MDSAQGGSLSEEELRRGIWEEADAVDENCDFSSQRHFNTAASCERRHYGLGGGAIVLAAMAAGTLLYPPWFSAWLGGISAIGSAALTGAATLLKPKETSAAHFRAGNAYLALRNEARSFKRLDCRDPRSDSLTLLTRVRELTSGLDRLNDAHGGLFTPGWAYFKARRDIRRGQTRTRADGRRRPGEPITAPPRA